MEPGLKAILLTGFLFLSANLAAQDSGAYLSDTSFSKEMQEIVVTATRNERRLGNIAVPTSIISKKTIKLSGALRLSDALNEQTGLFITSPGSTSTTGGGIFGNGVQLQGLDPAYTLILINGEPVIGRNGGTLNLRRLSVTHIRKIEIVKGPGSSLYGSEAMGGVINIITDQPTGNNAEVGFRYGSFGATDVNAAWQHNTLRSGIGVSINRNASKGYDLNPKETGFTADPYHNYTAELQYRLNISSKLRFTLQSRFFTEKRNNLLDAGNVLVDGATKQMDYNIAPTLQYRFTDKIKTTLRIYTTQYQSSQRLYRAHTDSLHYNDYFSQQFYRIENQTDLRLGTHQLTAGAGIAQEILITNRYNSTKKNRIAYAFAQDEWQPFSRLTVISGFRFDHNQQYQSVFTPRLAAQYQVNSKLKINASAGTGFKAPDFRQLYLNFTNYASDGYSVFGANEISLNQLLGQQSLGLITTIMPEAYGLKKLLPETSVGINIGLQYQPADQWLIKLNAFRNDIANLIQFRIIAFRANNERIYSYFNVDRALTEGGEIEISYKAGAHLQFTGGYQFLYTADKKVLAAIRNGELYGKDNDMASARLLSLADYGGLPNRSRHLANLRVFYDNVPTGWFGSLRMIYRSRWGVEDRDGNLVINRDDEYAKGFLQANISAGKQLGKSLRAQAGVDNLLNYRDAINLPGNPGRTWFASFTYSFNSK
jgi:outer membrane receptor for ferrienterochelin and colicins